jgi:hypothetical protein
VAASLPAGTLANLLSLPARHFAVIDAGSQRTRILVASVARGRPRLERTLVIDPFEDGATSPEELREDVRERLRTLAPEALILVTPPQQVLRHVLDTPPADAAHTRALVEREASSIGGLSETQWAFDSVRLRPFGRLAHPLGAAFIRQDHLEELLGAWTDDDRVVFDVRAAGDALAAAFLATASPDRHAVLIDLGARHTAVTVIVDAQPVFTTSFPSGSDVFTTALATDRGCPQETAEALKRSDPPAIDPATTPALHAGLLSWLRELERTILEWRDDHPRPRHCGRHLAGHPLRWRCPATPPRPNPVEPRTPSLPGLARRGQDRPPDACHRPTSPPAGAPCFWPSAPARVGRPHRSSHPPSANTGPANVCGACC